MMVFAVAVMMTTLSKHTIGNLLLLRGECRIQGLGCRDHLVQARGALGQTLLAAFETLDRSDGRPRRLGRVQARGVAALALILRSRRFPLRAALLESLVHGACVLAQDVGEVIPLRLLCIGDFQLGAGEREAGLDALARGAELLRIARLLLRAGGIGRALLGCLRDDDRSIGRGIGRLGERDRGSNGENGGQGSGQ
jgi:hypothetical protein